MKDPAVLFYFQDFLVGTDLMSADEVGKYIRILCHQADKGALTLPQLKRICEGNVPEAVMDKLRIDEEGKYYQDRMRTEREKRISYSESRRQNRIKKEDNICKTYDIHMENENININKECLLKERETEFKESVKQYSNQYPVNMLKSFCDYWTEPNKSKTKMRFELEKTFEISRRLVTWASRDKTFIKTEHAQSEPAYYKPLPKL
jgi:hypothetical protein